MQFKSFKEHFEEYTQRVIPADASRGQICGYKLLMKAAECAAQQQAAECAAQQRKLDEQFKMESLRRRLIWQALCCVVPPTLDESHLIGAAERYVPYDKKDRELFSAAVFGRGKKELDRNKVDKLSFDELQRVIVFGELFDGVRCQSEWDLDRKNHQTAPLFAAAKRFKLDMDAIEEQVKSEISGSMPVPAEAKTPAKAKASKAKKVKKGKAKK